MEVRRERLKCSRQLGPKAQPQFVYGFIGDIWGHIGVYGVIQGLGFPEC